MWILGLAIVGAVDLGIVALFEARKLAKAHRGRPLIAPGRDWRREAVRFTTRAVAFCSIFALVPAVTGALRMTPSDPVTSTLWAYEGDATVVDVSSGKNPWVRLSLESGQEVVLKGLSTFELNEDFDNGDWDTPRHVTVRCQAWHSWIPLTGGYVSAWCENPRFGEERVPGTTQAPRIPSGGMTTLRRPFLLIAAPALAALLTLSACAAPGGSAGSPTTQGATAGGAQVPGGTEARAASGDAAAILTAAGLSGLGSAPAEAVVETLEAIPVNERPTGLAASVTSDAVQLTGADGVQASLPLERFYLSVAPFISTTHECTFHAPVGCKGELADTEASFTITDAGTGEVLFSGTRRTASNGFAGFWLPWDRTVTVVVQARGKRGSVTTGTGAGDPTCLTTLRLS